MTCAVRSGPVFSSDVVFVISYKTSYVLSLCVCFGCRDTKSLQVQVWLQTAAVGLEDQKHYVNITMVDIRNEFKFNPN